MERLGKIIAATTFGPARRLAKAMPRDFAKYWLGLMASVIFTAAWNNYQIRLRNEEIANLNREVRILNLMLSEEPF